MSFGVSIGDFLAVGRLVKDIVSSLKSAGDDYLEAVLELQSLERALQDVENVQPPLGHELEVNAIKIAALLCYHPLQQFKEKLEQYHCLELGRKASRVDTKLWASKTRWSLSMNEEAQKLRTYLSAHISSLNVRLSALGISLQRDNDEFTKKSLASIQEDISGVYRNLNDLQTGIDQAHAVSTTLESNVRLLFSLVFNSALPRLTALFDLMCVIVALLTRLSATQNIDPSLTWFQKPLRFEDAFGRVLPVPAEYGWNILQSIIRDRFQSGPASGRVMAGEYEIFNSLDSSQTLNSDNFAQISPGSSITMALVVGWYEALDKSKCPKPHCGSRNTTTKSAGGLECNLCQTWFGASEMKLPRPFRAFTVGASSTSIGSSEPNERTHAQYARLSLTEIRNIFQSLREERKWLKNVRLNETHTAEFALLFKEHTYKPRHAKSSLPSPQSNENTYSDVWPQARKVLADMLEVDESQLEKDADGEMRVDEYGMDSLLMLELHFKLEDELKVEELNNMNSSYGRRD